MTYSLRIPGHHPGLTCDPEPTGTKLEIAQKLLMPDPEKDPHGARQLPKDTDCILEEIRIVDIGSESRKEVDMVGRYTVGQLLPQGFLLDLF